MGWSTLERPLDAKPPAPMTVRVQALPARSEFPDHTHEWGQVAYAISGVLAVYVPGQSFVISPKHAAWLPAGVAHRVGSLLGAEYRSLWVATEAVDLLPGQPMVFDVTPLLQALIVEAAELPDADGDDGYRDRVTRLILDQLCRATPAAAALPWPRNEALARLCEALYADPADARSAEAWSAELCMSVRTMTRRFEEEMGMGLRSWRRRMRMFKAVELLGGGLDVTRTALELGYGSTSAFIYAFRTSMGVSPQAYVRNCAFDPR